MPDVHQTELPVSVHVLTFQSGKTLRRALQSVRDCKEIILIDGGSIDETLSIGKDFGARVLSQPQKGPLTDFSTARNVALEQTTQPWILALDSDELISPMLMEEIAAIIHGKTAPAAYFVPRRYVGSDGTEILHATTYPNERIYFFHRDAALRWVKPVHERIELRPGTPLRHLRGASLAPLPTIEEAKEKNRRYIALEIALSRRRGWGHWLRHRVLRGIRSRTIATIRLAGIWLLPHRGKRLPLRHEFLRYEYQWRVAMDTCPLNARQSTHSYIVIRNAPLMPTLIDHCYRSIRPYRFLYGWAKDRYSRMQCSKRAEHWKAKGFLGAKLDVCGGRNPFDSEEYLNADIVALPKVDLVFDITKTFPIPEGVIAEVISIATLEHLRKPAVHHVLREFFRILQPGGFLRVSTPDIEAIAKGVLAGGDPDVLNQQLFGKYKSDQTEDYDLHRWMYTAKQMIEVLGQIGFERCERIPMDIGMHDAAYTYLVRGYKPPQA
ncbi:glycosyltransferase [Candidatus Peregrinibacteria bacterium]|nr:glycosyltransferase [Candidatus Peregrinibacteria bacterium]MBI3816629.1 glycosyltransferase [Candidatus Peregrinibacteria bacterium]